MTWSQRRRGGGKCRLRGQRTWRPQTPVSMAACICIPIYHKSTNLQCQKILLLSHKISSFIHSLLVCFSSLMLLLLREKTSSFLCILNGFMFSRVSIRSSGGQHSDRSRATNSLSKEMSRKSLYSRFEVLITQIS